MPETGESSELREGAERGDPAAKFAYGLTLLAGREAGVKGPRGIEMIEEAAAAGEADALAMSALFEAMGALRPQNWSAAFDKLRQAADLGSQSAQDQVRVLQERGSDELSVEALLAPPSREKISETPRIIAYPGFASPLECDWVMRRAADRLVPAKVFDKASGDETYDAVRDNSSIELLLADMDLVMEVLRARISAATRLPVPLFEPTQILHYSVGEQFRPHHDYFDPAVPSFADEIRNFGQRIATVLIYLNSDYTGGETVFPKIGVSYRGRPGDALFFTNVDRTGRGDPLSTHAGTPPTSGEKWIMSQWIRDRIPASATPPQPAS